MRTRTWLGGVAALMALASACGDGSSGSSGGATSSSSSGGGTAGGGGAGGFAIAPHPDPPQVVSGGTVMKAPKVVSVSFPSDPLEAQIDAFSTAIGKTTYWGDSTKEYGVGPLTPIARIHSSFAPSATFDDTAIRTWLVGQLDGTHPEWPAPDGDTVYALYFPPGVKITVGGFGTSCSQFHGYHDSTQLGDGTPVVYAVISRCPSIPEDPTAQGIDYVSAVASHELVEAITDPLVSTKTTGYSMPDPDHIAWAFLGLAELGDLCALVGGAFFKPADFPYEVQRVWSNQAAMAGHEPCLPQPAGQVYFNAAPVMNDTVSFNDQGFFGKTKGVQIAVGDTKTVEVDLFSEAPTQGPWNVKVSEVGGSYLDLSLDKTSGQNGDKLVLTIHVKSKNPTYGAELFRIQSTQGNQKNFWIGIVGN